MVIASLKTVKFTKKSLLSHFFYEKYNLPASLHCTATRRWCIAGDLCSCAGAVGYACTLPLRTRRKTVFYPVDKLLPQWYILYVTEICRHITFVSDFQRLGHCLSELI